MFQSGDNTVDHCTKNMSFSDVQSQNYVKIRWKQDLLISRDNDAQLKKLWMVYVTSLFSFTYPEVSTAVRHNIW
jgi:hypothetical protein